ncbi:MAG TPA: AraC family transcriptional regulator [Polyangiales bacterium]|nr:AraC family transcriptional regulator [Polyangiales bacterium]
MSTDTLSEVLRALRLTGAVYFDVRAIAPWVAEAPPAALVGPQILPSADHVIEYHVVTSGSCYAGLLDGAPVLLEQGDIVVFPQGDAHVMSSAPGMRHPPDLGDYRRDAALPFVLNLGDGDADPASLVCGFLGCDARPFNPVLATLPRMLVVRGRGANTMREHLVQVAVAESKQRRAGGECALSRLSELLFIEVIRDFLAELPAESASWLGGLRDPTIGRALSALHGRPAHGWTLDELAREVGASRSVLAERFNYYAGVPPMQYLAQWRMQLAAHLLRDGAAGIAEIAQQVGYASEAAFSRAYKRLVGVAPALWRQGVRSGENVPTNTLSS